MDERKQRKWKQKEKQIQVERKTQSARDNGGERKNDKERFKVIGIKKERKKKQTNKQTK